MRRLKNVVIFSKERTIFGIIEKLSVHQSIFTIQILTVTQSFFTM